MICINLYVIKSAKFLKVSCYYLVRACMLVKYFMFHMQFFGCVKFVIKSNSYHNNV